MLGRASSNALIAASPLLTSTISKLPSAKVCVTSRRIVGLSSAIRIFGFIPLEFLQRPRYQKRADGVRPFSWSPIPLLARGGEHLSGVSLPAACPAALLWSRY